MSQADPPAFAAAHQGAIHEAALDWYASNRRDLAFRRTSDPWAVLLLEVIAQQTQAVRAADAWTRLIERYPTPAAMAAASAADVIRDWRGLGYNRRALSLHRAATAIVAEHGGRVPDSLGALQALPGIGPYTARAILATAFNRDVAALDVNVRRVLGRAFGIDGMSPRARQAAADELVPRGRAAAWTHALMDIGAAFCRPREPRCEACPLRDVCRFASSGGTAAVSAGTPTPTDGRRPAPRFESTTRWLRGRILDRLRDAADGQQVDFDAPIGEHDHAAVRSALAAMSAEGMIVLEGATRAALL